MPLTCGRTSAIRNALVRPASSRSSVTGRDCRVTTVTSGGGGAGGGASPEQAARTKGRARERASDRERSGRMVGSGRRCRGAKQEIGRASCRERGCQYV